MTITRRDFLKGAAIAGAGLALPLKFGVRESHAFYQTGVPLKKWVMDLRGVGPGQIPVAASDGVLANGATHITMNIQQFTDKLHSALNPTTLWGFNPANPLGGGNQPAKHLGGIIVVNRGTHLQFTFRNQLTSNGLPSGTGLRNIIPVDATLPGANTAQNRIAVHLHGGLVPWISDGGPFDWFAPNGTHGLSFMNNQVLNPGALSNEADYYYPNDQSARLLWYHDHAHGITRINAYAGVASAYIIRDTYEAAMLGLGLPEFIETSVLAVPSRPIREIPIIVQDKIFVGSNIGTADPTWPGPKAVGSLWYPHLYEKNRWRLLGAGSRLPNPSVIAEMFGDTMLVNGTVFPKMTVEARRYRLRILNACNARFLNLQLLVANQINGSPVAIPDDILITNGVAQNDKGPDWLVLGTEGGFLPAPVSVSSKVPFDPNTFNGSLITGNAERYDVLVDFTSFAGKSVILYSDAAAPFPGGDDRNDYYYGNPLNPFSPTVAGYGPNTRQLMRFDVVSATGVDPSLDLVQNTNGVLSWNPSIDQHKPGLQVSGIDNFLATVNPDGTFTVNPGVTVSKTRPLTLNEEFDAYGRLVQMIGTNVSPGSNGRFARTYLSTPTETPTAGDVEIWEIANLTGDTHPIHFHLVNLQILNRQQFNALSYNGTPQFTGPPTPPAPYETGWKETVRMNPGEVIRVIMKFDLPASLPFIVPSSPRTTGNEYVFHCHILEHEEHDMMRPLVVI